MALIGNRSVLLKSPGRYFGGSTVSDNRSNFGTPGSTRCRYFDGFPQINATPSGYRPPYSWIIAIKNGEMASVNNLNGTTTISPLSMAAGVNGQATLTGSGDITSAVAQLVISMVATLTGSTSLSSADLRGYLNAVASLSGGGTLTSAIGALAWANAALAGTGTITNATPYATGTLSANIRGYSDLTPEGIRDSVWGAIAANYTNAGTMGQKLNSAASGGVDYNALAAAVWEYATRTLTSGSPTEAQIADAVWAQVLENGLNAEQIIRLMTAVLLGKVTGAGTGTERFRDQADTKDRIVATVDSSGNRSAIIEDAS